MGFFLQQRDVGFTLPPVHRLSQKARFPLGLSKVSSEVPAEIWEGGGGPTLHDPRDMESRNASLHLLYHPKSSGKLKALK